MHRQIEPRLALLQKPFDVAAFLPPGEAGEAILGPEWPEVCGLGGIHYSVLR